jgi:hypothetical protein
MGAAPLAIILLISGLTIWRSIRTIYVWLTGKFTEFLPGEWRRKPAPTRRIAIFVPSAGACGRGQMLDHNLAASAIPTIISLPVHILTTS